MKKKPLFERIGDFMAGRGFYIVLFLCVAAIGVSGYYLFSSLDMNGGDVSVASPTQVVVTARPTPAAVKPTVAPAPVSTPKPTPAPTPAPAPVPAKTAIYTWPVKGEVLKDFSLEAFAFDETMGDYRVHTSMDIAAVVGTQVKALSHGTVTGLEQDDLLGTVVTIDHGEGLESMYSNLAALPAVEVGDVVETGQVIGAVGKTAIAEGDVGDHLHFTMRLDGGEVDPMEYLPK